VNIRAVLQPACPTISCNMIITISLPQPTSRTVCRAQSPWYFPLPLAATAQRTPRRAHSPRRRRAQCSTVLPATRAATRPPLQRGGRRNRAGHPLKGELGRGEFSMRGASLTLPCPSGQLTDTSACSVTVTAASAGPRTSLGTGPRYTSNPII
jgi:hypothetical protein